MKINRPINDYRNIINIVVHNAVKHVPLQGMLLLYILLIPEVKNGLNLAWLISAKTHHVSELFVSIFDNSDEY